MVTKNPKLGDNIASLSNQNYCWSVKSLDYVSKSGESGLHQAKVCNHIFGGFPMPSSMRLLKCPACGGPLDPPAGESTMKCTYCGNSVVIPESLRLPKQGTSNPQANIFSGIDMNAMVGYGTQWAEVVQLAQGGNKVDAIKKYMKLTGNDE